MLEICPRGAKKNRFFILLFLQRLPKELCSYLEGKERDPARLDGEADCKRARHSQDQPVMVNMVAKEYS
jgi:hypothetical protein